MKTVLVTGASGFIGRHTLSLLQAHRYEVHAVSSKVVPSTSIIWHRANLLNPEEIRSLVSSIRPTHLLHLAWIATPRVFWQSPENLNWIESSLELVRAFAKCGGKRIVVAGSSAEYTPSTLCTEDSNSFLPATLYGKSKRELYLILESFSKQMNIEFAWGYLFYLFGPSEHPDRFIPAVILGLLRQKEIPCTHGEQIRDYLYSADAASAFVELLGSSLQGGVNIASGQGISLQELARKAARKIGGLDLLKFGSLPPPPNDPPEVVADIRRIKEQLKWQPCKTIDQRLDETIAWWKENLLHSV